MEWLRRVPSRRSQRGPTPQAAIEEADREEMAYVMGLYAGTDVDAPDFLAVVGVNPRRGMLELDEKSLVDFGELPEGLARAHEIRWPDGDCTSDVWL